MPYNILISLIAIIILALLHYVSAKLLKSNFLWHGRFLSFAGGVSVSYVFVELLPKLNIAQKALETSPLGVLPFFEKHVYVLALVGLLFFYAVEQMNSHSQGLHKSLIPFWISTLAYGSFNFLVGYAVSDPNDLEVQPLYLFTIAMGLHMFINDHTFYHSHQNAYLQLGRNVIVGMLLLGWMIGLATEIPAAAVALVVGFVSGGMIMNVLQHEIPSGHRSHTLKPFVLGAISYTIILLFLGAYPLK